MSKTDLIVFSKVFFCFCFISQSNMLSIMSSLLSKYQQINNNWPRFKDITFQETVLARDMELALVQYKVRPHEQSHFFWSILQGLGRKENQNPT